jgi:hypothetical protein
MKKLIFTLLVIIIFIPLAKAQKTRFGVTGGVILSNYTTEHMMDFSGGKVSSDQKWGFSVGVTADFPLGKNFSFQPALQFLQKGGSENIMGWTVSTRFNDLELPLNFLYRAPEKNGHFVVGAGPTLAYALSGSEIGKSNGVTHTEKITFGSGDTDMKPFEMGANILAGYEWKEGFFFQANYNIGITDLSNVNISPWKNR